MNGHDGNVAFKCTYNDGGSTGFVGFDGTCSNENIRRNVKGVKGFKMRVWCSNEDNHCRRFHDRGFRGRRPIHPCYESQIFQTWQYSSGGYLSGEREGEPIPMHQAQVGRVVLLTTRLPDHDTEKQRIVFGVFKIDRIEDDQNGTWAIGDPDYAIRLPKTAALALPYWKFKNGQPIWGSGLFRYVSDQEVTNFLHALFPRLQSPKDRSVLERLLECCGNLTPEDIPEDLDRQITEIDLGQKYGPGGEGKPHRNLKDYIAEHPDVLELGQAERVSVEHRFMTGDRSDLSIDFINGEHCVVEVEVEGADSTLIGAHQALKYRALRAGELDQAGKRIHAFLVAYDIPQSTREFCKRHGIKALEIQPAPTS